jgi:hypothetical protein
MFKTGLIVAGAAVIAGCAPHLHQLRADSSPALARGEFIHENPRRLTLMIGDRRYTAEGFEIHRHTNLAELQRRYRNTNPKHWDRVSAGLDRSHETYSAEPAPKSADGAELTCQLAWGAGKTPQGACQDKAGAEYQVHFD